MCYNDKCFQFPKQSNTLDKVVIDKQTLAVANTFPGFDPSANKYSFPPA